MRGDTAGNGVTLMNSTGDADTPSPITLSLIVAVADNGVIGRGNALPWRLGSDLKRFRKLTMGHPLIMGRHTFESIGKPLDGRDSIVVTRGAPAAEGEGLFFAPSLEEAIGLAEARARGRGAGEVFIIGGARLFEHALPRGHADLPDAGARLARRRRLLEPAIRRRMDRGIAGRAAGRRQG